MIKLIYNPTYTFTNRDIFDASDSEITYEAWSRQTPDWAKLALEWKEDEGQDVERALELVAMGIVSVSQNGERYPLGGREGAEALRDAIEEQNPGQGDTFIKHLAWGHNSYHFRRLRDLVGNSAAPSPESSDGKILQTSKLAA